MRLLEGAKSILKFSLLVESTGNPIASESSPWRLINATNSGQWMGKEPGSCMVVDIFQTRPIAAGKAALTDHAEFSVQVGYRPKGWTSAERDGGRQRLNGWRLEIRDQKKDGTLLDGDGNVLPPGGEPVYLPFTIYGSADFNAFSFGDLNGEG